MRYEPAKEYLNLLDPIQIALGLLAGQLDPAASKMVSVG